MPLRPDPSVSPAYRPSFVLWLILPALVCASIAGLIAASDWNTGLFLRWNAAAHGWLPPALWAGITNLGATLGAFCLIAPALARWPRLVASTLLAAPFAGLFAQGLKYAYAEPRPAAVLAADAFNVVGLPLRTDSFPSGHSTTAFVLAGVIAFHALRRGRRWPAVAALVLAALIAFSRIAVGAHWPLDIFTGAAGGWLCAAIGCTLAARWRFWSRTAGIRTMAVLFALLAVTFTLEDVGYPEGLWAQYLLVAWGLAGAIAGFLRAPALQRLAEER